MNVDGSIGTSADPNPTQTDLNESIERHQDDHDNSIRVAEDDRNLIGGDADPTIIYSYKDFFGTNNPHGEVQENYEGILGYYNSLEVDEDPHEVSFYLPLLYLYKINTAAVLIIFYF